MPMVDVQVRIPKVPGFSQEALLGLVQSTISSLQPWAPLSAPQALADAACAVVGDIVALQQLQTELLESPSNYRWRMALVRPMKVQLTTDPADGGMVQIELVLEAPTHFAKCQTTDETASYLTMVGYLTSMTMRGLTALQGLRARFEPPFPPADSASA